MANCCILSIKLISFLVWGAQMTAEYFTVGLTIYLQLSVGACTIVGPVTLKKILVFEVICFYVF